MKLPSPTDWVYMAMVVDKDCHLTCPAFNCVICTLSTCVDIEELILLLLGEYGHGPRSRANHQAGFIRINGSHRDAIFSFPRSPQHLLHAQNLVTIYVFQQCAE